VAAAAARSWQCSVVLARSVGVRRPSGLASAAAFAILALVLPSAASAEIDATGKELRPAQESCTLDGVHVTLDVDRSVVLTGDRVKATLVADGDAGKQVAVEVSTLHSENHAGEPADIGPTRIAHQIVHLTAAPGGGPPVVTTLKLGKRLTHRAWIDRFAIFIAAPGTPVPDQPIEWSDTHGFWEVLQTGGAAVVPVLGWSGDTLDMKIEATSPITLDAPFTIAVRLTNTSGRSLPHDLWVELTAADAFGPGITELEIVRIQDPADPNDGSWPRRAVHVARFKILPHTTTRHLVFLAKVLVHDPDKLGPAFLAGAIEGAAFDAAEPAKLPAKPQ
jgi:hypothetical protein